MKTFINVVTESVSFSIQSDLEDYCCCYWCALAQNLANVFYQRRILIKNISFFLESLASGINLLTSVCNWYFYFGRKRGKARKD